MGLKNRTGWGRVEALLVIPAVALLALFAAACSANSDNDAQVMAATDRTFYVQATELDARRTLNQNEFPQATRDAFPVYFGESDDITKDGGSGGYYLFMTGENEWRIGSYMFVPQGLIAYQGDRVTLEVLGVRGGHHGNILVGPDGKPVNGPDGKPVQFDVNRGELHVVNFTAEQIGVYQLICLDHGPGMVMNIHVFGR